MHCSIIIAVTAASTHPSRSGLCGAHLHGDGVALVLQQRSSVTQLYVEVGGVWSEAEVLTEESKNSTQNYRPVGQSELSQIKIHKCYRMKYSASIHQLLFFIHKQDFKGLVHQMVKKPKCSVAVSAYFSEVWFSVCIFPL